MRILAICAALAATTLAAEAATISGTGDAGTDPLFADATFVGFEGTATGSYSQLTFGDLTIDGIDGPFRIGSTFAGNYNGRGTVYLDNNGGSTSGLSFTFATEVSAFAFNFGASDDSWTVTAFDAIGNVIETAAAPIVNASNAGDYIGISAAGIASFTLTTTGADDYVFVDDIVFNSGASVAPVPLPAGLPLLLAGLGGLALTRRRG